MMSLNVRSFMLTLYRRVDSDAFALSYDEVGTIWQSNILCCIEWTWLMTDGWLEYLGARGWSGFLSMIAPTP